MIYHIEAPEGFKCLSKGERYILIRNRTGDPVSFLHFDAERNGRVLRMNQKDFEDGLALTVRWYLEHRDWCESVQSGKYRRERLGLGARGSE